MERYKHNKEKWGKLITDLGFKPEYVDIVNEYVEVHTQNELINIAHVAGEIPETRLPYALRVLLHLQNNDCLDKIHFTDRPAGDDDEKLVPIVTVMTKYNFSDEMNFVEDKEAYQASVFTMDTAENLIKLMKSKEIYIYMLFSDMKTFDNILHIFHRFGTKDKTIE